MLHLTHESRRKETYENKEEISRARKTTGQHREREGGSWKQARARCGEE